jgi:sodium/bile acid cotransporter 7
MIDRSHRRNIKKGVKQWPTIALLSSLLIVILGPAVSASGDRQLSDAEKKGVVYRLYAGYKKEFPAVKDISPQRAMELMNQNMVVFVDTRKPAEIAVSKLPGAVSKPDFLSDPDRYQNMTIVAYCTISYRSGVFAREMSKQGITVMNLQGGILAWILEGGKVYGKSGEVVKRVHVYGDKWDYVPAGYESVKFGLWQQIL